MVVATARKGLHPLEFSYTPVVPAGQSCDDTLCSLDTLLTFKEAMNYLRVSRSTLYRLMWSGQLAGHKVGSTWRFYRVDLQACVRGTSTQPTAQGNESVISQDHTIALATGR